MREPAATVPRCNSVPRPLGNPKQNLLRPRGVLSHVLLLKAPTWLDRVEVVRIGRQVHDAHSVCGAERHDAIVVMGLQVVEHQDVASIQSPQELAAKPVHESLSVRGLEHGAHQDPAGQTHCTEQREVVSPVHRSSEFVRRTPDPS